MHDAKEGVREIDREREREREERELFIHGHDRKEKTLLPTSSALEEKKPTTRYFYNTQHSVLLQ